MLWVNGQGVTSRLGTVEEAGLGTGCQSSSVVPLEKRCTELLRRQLRIHICIWWRRLGQRGRELGSEVVRLQKWWDGGPSTLTAWIQYAWACLLWTLLS